MAPKSLIQMRTNIKLKKISLNSRQAPFIFIIFTKLTGKSDLGKQWRLIKYLTAGVLESTDSCCHNNTVRCLSFDVYIAL